MTTRIGINGFGRMGRLALRAAWGWPDLEFVHINEVKGGPEVGATCSTFDSVHGRWDARRRGTDDAIVIDGQEGRLHATRARPATCPGRSAASTSCSSAPGSSGRRRCSRRTSTAA